MAWNLTEDVLFTGPALPETFVRLELEGMLRPFFPKGGDLRDKWRDFRRALVQPLSQEATAVRVRNVVVAPLAKVLGYTFIEEPESKIATREGQEPAGELLLGGDVRLRTWVLDSKDDIDAPDKRGRGYRYAPGRIAARVLRATGEDLGLLCNGIEVRIVLDPARSDSTVSFLLGPWRKRRFTDEPPDGFQFLLALLDPAARAKLPDILDKARLVQGQVTKDLRVQAREAVEGFVNHVLTHPENRAHEEFAVVFATGEADHARQEALNRLSRQLWHEALTLVYRLLFILKGESSGAFGFASLSLWKNTYSPSAALGWVAKDVREKHLVTGEYLEHGLRRLFEIFEKGVSCPELTIDPLGGQLFGAETTPLLSKVRWGEEACAVLLDKLLRAPRGKGKARTLVRLSYRDLDVEELGRVYEALLELEPQITHTNMVRLRRAKLEVVVPETQAEKYKPADQGAKVEVEGIEESGEEPEEADDEAAGKKVKVEWVKAITRGQFILKTGLGRKASGAYYTPDTFVRFLVRETLCPQVDKASPKDDPNPCEILKLKVLDPAMGSGHFLVGACRYLAERLYEDARACAARGHEAEDKAEKTTDPDERERFNEEAEKWWNRVIDLPDHDDELLRYLPGRVREGDADTGLSPEKAHMVCRRLVAVHCLYGVDKNPLAVELAKVSLWLVSQAEGMPLTFLDHRLVVGDSLTGPFWTHLLNRPSDNFPFVEDLFAKNLYANFTKTLSAAIKEVDLLERDVGATLTENDTKRQENDRLHRLLAPFRVLAAAWSGGVMLGKEGCDVNDLQ